MKQNEFNMEIRQTKTKLSQANIKSEQSNSNFEIYKRTFKMKYYIMITNKLK